MRAADPAAKLAELLSRPLVKVCGLTREEDVAAAAEAGADLAGFILAPRARARRPLCSPVPDGAALGRRLRRRGGGDRRGPRPAATRVEDGKVRGREAALLRGGEEVARCSTCPWEGDGPGHSSARRAAEGRIVLAGGLGPDNVRAAIAAVRPWAVDASSSLESAPGIKDHDKVQAFVEAART